MKNILFLSCLFCCLFSCQQTVSRKKIREFAETIHENSCCQIKAPQQQFVNKLTEALKNLMRNDTSDIDTKLLTELLSHAKEANRISYENINNTVEVDNGINLRQKALNENRLFYSLYNNEFAKTIDILASNDSDKREKLSKIIDEKLEEKVNQVQNASKEASKEFVNKYDISFSDSSDN